MSWNPVNWVKSGVNAVSGGLHDIFGSPGSAAEDERKKQLAQQAAAAGGFANTGEHNYNQGTADLNAQRDYLRNIASGKDSLSAMQLQQGLQQNVAAQQSMAAGASPQNAAMAARTAAMQQGRLGADASGRAAMAGLQERRDANNALSQMMLTQRGQDQGVALGSRGNALTGYGAGAQGAPEKSWLEKNGQAIAGIGGLLASDRNLKTDIEDADEKAKSVTDGLRAYAYKYKDAKYGKGEQLGVMAQDLEAAGLGQAVINEPDGKKVDPGKLAGANTAMLAALGRRVSKLEG